MTGLAFAEPGWVHAFWGLGVFLGVIAWLERRGGAALESLIAPALQARLVRRPYALPIPPYRRPDRRR